VGGWESRVKDCLQQSKINKIGIEKWGWAASLQLAAKTNIFVITKIQMQ
jgi:hypothetical protein